MKAVLMSIQPKWCELIASGQKTVEVRKTKPKVEAPFKVYIYCTKDNTFADKTLRGFDENGKAIYYKANKGKVIGEFVCDAITVYGYDEHIGYPTPSYEGDPSFRDCGAGYWITCGEMEDTCLSDEEFDAYGNKQTLYGWHITDLVIYDEPRELGEFIVPSKIGCCSEGKCRGCKFFDCGNGFNIEDDCNAKFSTDEYKPLRRPPQSWCYVEEVKSDAR